MLKELKCALPPPPLIAFASAPVNITPRSRGSLAANELCSLDDDGRGTYTTAGITKLCEGLKESNVTSLECAPPQSVLLSCQWPLTRLSTHLCSRARSLGSNRLGPEGGAALAEGLKGNSTLQLLE